MDAIRSPWGISCSSAAFYKRGSIYPSYTKVIRCQSEGIYKGADPFVHALKNAIKNSYHPKVYPSLRPKRTRAALLPPSISLLHAHQFLHEGDIIVLGQILIILSASTWMLRHGLDHLFDNFVWNERVSKIHFGDVWLNCAVSRNTAMGPEEEHTLPSATSLKLSKTCSAVF